jgi:hypothetical protein
MRFKILKRKGSCGRALIHAANGLVFEINGGSWNWNKHSKPLRWFEIHGRLFPLPRYRGDGWVGYFSWARCLHDHHIWILDSRQINPLDLERLPEAEQKRANQYCQKYWPTKRVVCHRDGTFSWWFPTNSWHYDLDHFGKQNLLWMPAKEQRRILTHFVRFGYYEGLTSVQRTQYPDSTLFTADRAEEVLKTTWRNPWQWSHHDTIYR